MQVEQTAAFGVEAPQGTGSTARATRRPDPDAPRFKEVLHALGTAVDRGEATVRAALQGVGRRELGAADLIALQARIYRYTECVDLAAKLVDRAGSAIRTSLQGQ